MIHRNTEKVFTTEITEDTEEIIFSPCSPW
jgi:hypothetical protein